MHCKNNLGTVSYYLYSCKYLYFNRFIHRATRCWR